MEKVIVNVGKTPNGYSAEIAILSGWALGVFGTFADFKRELAESIDIFITFSFCLSISIIHQDRNVPTTKKLLT